MINTETPHSRTIAARLGHDSRYANSIHDDAAAQKFGFRGALVGGTSVTSYMTHLFVEAWGERWLAHGTLAQRNRRPVYDGDTVIATAAPIRIDPNGLIAEVVLRDETSEELAYATGGLPNVAPTPPDLARFPHRPMPANPAAIAPGGHRPGDPMFATPVIYTQALHDTYLDRVRETLPIFTRDGIAHPGALFVQTMHDGTASYRRPTPGIHVSATAEFYNLARIGDEISTSGEIVRVFEHKGSHYFEAEQLVIANRTTPVALFRRISIYARLAPA